MFRVIRLGDKTSHGGEVVSAADNYTVMEKNVAREGDKCTCPKKGHGQCEIVGGDPNWSIDGRAVALQGISKTSCGADLISSCGELGRSFDGEGAASGLNRIAMEAASIISAAEQRSSYDQHFLLLNDQTGQPLANVRYKITLSNGDEYSGISDGNGKTTLVSSNTPLQAEIEVFV